MDLEYAFLEEVNWVNGSMNNFETEKKYLQLYASSYVPGCNFDFEHRAVLSQSSHITKTRVISEVNTDCYITNLFL